MPTKKQGTGEGFEGIVIPEIKREIFEITIIGDTSLLCNKFSDRNKEKILEGSGPGKKKTRPKRNPVADFIDSMYWLTDPPKVDYEKDSVEAEKAFGEAIQSGAKFGFPATGIKKAAAAAGYRAEITKDQVTTLGFFHIVTDNGLVEILSEPPKMQEDVVRIPAANAADLRYRGRFDNWQMRLRILCNPHVFPPDKIISLINLAGFSVGIGDWRPEKKGSFGTFHVAMSGEV